MTTAVICCNKAGQYVAPVLTFSIEKDNPDLFNGAALETFAVCHFTGRM
jgi:hypothetical protein